MHLPLREHYRGMDPAVLFETARLKLRMVGLEEHGSKRPSGISGGMKKRVALARALALDPDLVFADEPTSGLDPVSTQEIDEMFIRLTRRIGAAAVVVTHDIASFFRIAHRAIMLGGERDGALQGRVIMQGNPEEFRASDQPVVRRFLDPGSHSHRKHERRRSKKTQSWVDRWAAVILLLFVGLFFGVEENPFRKPFLTFSIRFDDVSGIHERSKVTFLGIPAGYVKRLEYAPGSGESAVKVEVVIDRKLNIPAGVKAYLEPTLLGDASIALRLPAPAGGDSGAAEEQPEAGERLAEGAEIIGVRSTKLEAVMPGFDEAMAKIENVWRDRQANACRVIGEVIDRGVGALNSLFLDKSADGQTKIDQLIASLQGIINGPEGQKDQSIRGQLEIIVGNLMASSDSIRKLADLQGKEQGSIGEVLRVFEETAKRLSEDAEMAQKLIGKMGHTSDAVTQASEQVKNLALISTQAVEQFHSRPFHYLTTTRSAPATGSRSPEPSPKSEKLIWKRSIRGKNWPIGVSSTPLDLSAALQILTSSSDKFCPLRETSCNAGLARSRCPIQRPAI